MKIHRFIGDFDLSQSHLLIKDSGLAKQMRSVLKLHTGERIILSNGQGEEALCELGGYGADSVSVNILQPLVNDAEPASQVILYCSVLKRENFEWVAQKATEVGAKAVVPIVVARTVKLNLNLDRLGKIMREAAEQSGRAVVPMLHPVMQFDEALEHAAANAANYFFDVEGSLAQRQAGQGPVGIFIGPEGGWDERERAAVQERKFHILSLGKLVFRAETAAVIATYLFT